MLVSIFVTGTLPCLLLRRVEARLCLVVGLKPSSRPASFLAGLGRLLYPVPPRSCDCCALSQIIENYYLKLVGASCLCYDWCHTTLSSLPLIGVLLKLLALASAECNPKRVLEP